MRRSTLQLDRADRGLRAATSGARIAVTGLAAEGPVKVVNDERSRLVQAIARAEQEAERWEHAAGLLAAQARTHAGEEASVRNALAVAEARSAAVLDDAVRPLLAQATVDGEGYLDAHNQRVAARDEANSTGRLGRRSAKRRLEAARAAAQDARARVLDQWSSLPATDTWFANTRDGLDAWAERVAYERAHAAPSMSTARQQVEVAGEVLRQTRWRHRAEVEELTIGVYGRRDAASIRTVSGAHSAEARAQRWQQYADASRADLAHIESLPIGRAVQFIETRQAQIPRAGVGRTAAARDARLDLRTEHRIEQGDPELGRSM